MFKKVLIGAVFLSGIGTIMMSNTESADDSRFKKIVNYVFTGSSEGNPQMVEFVGDCKAKITRHNYSSGPDVFVIDFNEISTLEYGINPPQVIFSGNDLGVRIEKNGEFKVKKAFFYPRGNLEQSLDGLRIIARDFCKTKAPF